MLKRSDLAEQFNLVVKQEITNFNNRSSSFQDSINSLREYIEKVEKESRECKANLHSQIKLLEIDNENLKNVLLSCQEKSLRQLNDASHEIKRLLQSIDLVSANAREANRKNETIQNMVEKLTSCMESFDDDIKDHTTTINQVCEGITFKFQKDIERMKEDILSTPSQHSEKIEDLDKKLSSHMVDIAGVLREIRLNRHDLMVNEKKIENIYTLIERLKKSGRSE